MLLPLLLACTGPAPDSGDPGPRLETLALAEEIAQRGMDRMPAELQPQDWMQTVWGFSLLALGEASGDPAYADYDRRWMTTWLPELEAELAAGEAVFVSSDSTSPAILAAALDEEALAPIVGAADAYLESAPRTDEGAIEHWTEQAAFGVPDQVWIDSLFMLGQYMLERARATGDVTWLDRFDEQYLLFSELCRDPVDGLYRHAYDDLTDSNIPQDPVYWNRGNSWVLLVGVEALRLHDALGQPASAELEAQVQAHAQAVVAAQDASGLWTTILAPPGGPDPDNYLETSGSALLAAALARGVDGGVLPEALGAAVAPATQAVIDQVEWGDDGPIVTGTSFGTNPGEYQDYLAVGQVDDLVLGTGAVVLLLATVDGWPDPSAEEAP